MKDIEQRVEDVIVQGILDFISDSVVKIACKKLITERNITPGKIDGVIIDVKYNIIK